MEAKMRRVAMLLGMAGVIALGLAATPAPAQAQAGNGWWGHPTPREQAWRDHQRREWAWRHRAWSQHYWHPYQYGYNFR